MDSNEIPSPRTSPAKAGVSASATQLTGGPEPLSAELNQLARKLVEVVETLPDIAGVRLWQMVEGECVLWQQAGSILAGESGFAGGLPTDLGADRADGSRWAYPLRNHERNLGFLEVYGVTPDSNTRATLEKLTEIAAAALAQTEQHQTERDLSAILESTKLLNSTLDLSELLDIILQLSTRLCGADRGTVFLVDHHQDEIWSVKGLGLDKHEIRLPIDRGIAGWVAREGQSVRVAEASADPRFDPAVDHDLGYQTQELIALAIRNEAGKVVGVLELLNKQTGPFSAADEKALHHLCVHVAIALEKAQLHRAILAKRRMENDLELARSVQSGLLPQNLPDIPHMDIGVAYAPSLMVGGDYYDFMSIKPDSLLAVVADVEGKGVASALMMANLQASLHSIANHVHALERVIELVNDIVVSQTRVRKLLSMFIAVIDDRNRALHYINAGHVPPIVVGQAGDTATLEEGGMVLGVFPHAAYRRGRVQLRPGDIFVAYTDGVTEAMNVHGEQYGLERVAKLIHQRGSEPAQEIVKAVLADVGRFSIQGLNEDDRVMLVLKVE